MKKSLIILALAAPIFWQCNSGPSKKELNNMNDSLLIANAQKEVQLNKLVESLGSIQENLQIIKEKENIISLKATNGEMSEDSREQINDDINLIYNLMVDNKNRIQELEKQLKNSGVEKSRLNKLIESLTIELKERGEEILRLNELLANKDLEIGQLNQSVDNLTTSLETIREINKQTKEELETTKDLYNTAYYAMGTKKELKDRKITDKQGFLFFGSKKILPEGFDKQYFQTIDVRDTKVISITGKKAKLLTRHPNNSYELVNQGNGSITLNILDTDMFWSINKYLVVQIN